MLARAARALCKPSSPWPLALLRVAVCAIVLLSPEPRRSLELAAAPPESWLAPQGLTWFLPIFAMVAPHLWLVHRILQASAILALLGLWTRPSLVVLAVCFLFSFGGAQLEGAVLHDMHLSWLLLLLAVAPAAQVLSLDAWAAGDGWRSAAPSASAGIATRFARVLLGLVYFFPGVHKLIDAGLGWASAENLQHQLWLKWFQAGGELPWPRIDQWPVLLTAGGVAVVLFELGFLPCMALRRGRFAAALAGLAFHALTQHFMYIPFPSLWACYVVLWDGPRRGPAQARPERKPVLSFTLGVCLVFAVALQGARGETQAWPFACYPSFSEPAPATIADLVVEVRAGGGERQLRIGPLPPSPGQRRSPAQWSRVWSLAGLYGTAPSSAALNVFAMQLARRDGILLEAGSVLSFYVEHYATAPDTYGDSPLSRQLIEQARR